MDFMITDKKLPVSDITVLNLTFTRKEKDPRIQEEKIANDKNNNKERREVAEKSRN